MFINILIMASGTLILIFVLNNMWLVYAAVNCTATGAGRHADLDDKRCKNYTLCIYVKATDHYLAYDTSCPSTSLFNPKISRCTSPENFVCNTTAHIKPPPSTICTTDGYIADPDVNTCTTYIQCVEINGAYTQLRHHCPESTYFNPNTTLCEYNYNCISFSCSVPGRVADKYDFSCQRYYYCVKLFNGTYAQFAYSCPASSVFNPITKLCSTQYRCS